MKSNAGRTAVAGGQDVALGSEVAEGLARRVACQSLRPHIPQCISHQAPLFLAGVNRIDKYRSVLVQCTSCTLVAGQTPSCQTH